MQFIKIIFTRPSAEGVRAVGRGPLSSSWQGQHPRGPGQRGGWGFRAGGSQPNALEKGLGLGWGWEGSVTTFPAPSSVYFCGLQKGAH